MKNNLYRLLLLPWLLLAAWGARAQAPAWLSANGVPVSVNSDVRGVATNAAGDIFVTGSFEGSATFGSTTLNSTGSKDAYLAKWSVSTSSWAWAVSGNGGGTTTGDELSFGVAVNGNNVYIAGTFNSSNITVAGSTLTLNGAGGTDMFVAKYYDNGTSVTSRQARQVSTAGTDAARSIAVNPSTGTVYVAGFITGAANSTVSVAGSSLTLGGSGDMLVVRYTDANPGAGTSLADGGAVRGGGTSGDRADGIAVSSTGTIYVTGRVAAAGGTVSGTSLGSSGSNDIVLAKYTDSGSGLVNGGAVINGGTDSDLALGVAASGNTVYVVGAFFSSSLTFGSSTLTNTSPNQRMFLARYTDSGSLTATGAVTSSVNNAPIEIANAVTVAGGAIYVTGQYYGAPTISGTALPDGGSNGQVFLAKYTDAAVPTAAGAISGGSASGISDYGTALAPFGAQVIATGVIDPSSGAMFGSNTVPAGNTGFFARVGTAPTTITSIVPANASPTNAASVQFTVTFASSVTGVTAANFTTANGTGVTGSSVTGVTGSGTTYTVTVNTGSGSGTLGLTLANDTGLNPGISNDPFTGTPLYTIDKTAPTVAISSSTGASGSTSSAATFAYTVTFSESVTGFVAGDVAVGNGTLSGFSGSGTTYTFNVTPSANGAVTVNIAANVAQDAVGNGSTAASQYSITYAAPNTTVASVTRLTPSPTATTQVRYQVVFASSVAGLTVSNFNITTTGSVSGTNVSSVSGSGTTYTVAVNTGTGDGTLRLNVANGTNVSPTITNVPYVSGETYTITKSFAAAPQLTIAGTGGTGSDVTAFVDVVQVLSGGSAVANALRNGSFEQHDPLANGDYSYQPTNAFWTFNAQAGIAEDGSAFTPTTPIPNGISVAFVQTTGGNNGQLQQNLAVPTGSYQVNFQAAQRLCCTTLDQSLNVFINGVFVGNILPGTNGYTAFTSATFNVTAPALTATVSTTSTSPTSTAPVPYSVSFSQSVGTTFTASDVTVSGGAITSGSFSGSGSGPYTFTVTPSGAGTISVSLAANVATDANNTGNTASNAVSVQYNLPVTAAPVVIVPVNGSFQATTTPTYGGTAPAGSTIRVYVDGTLLSVTTTANSAGNWAVTQPSALTQGSHTVYATAQASGSTVSANSSTNTFTVDTVRPTVAISSSTAANNGSSSTSPFAYTVTFSEAVTGFVAGDVSVSNGTLSGFSGSGTTYSFNVTPASNGAVVTVNVAANVAQDRAGNGNTAATQYAITYNQAATATPVVTTPANGSFSNGRTVTVAGTAPAGSTVTVYINNAFAGTTTASAAGAFSLVVPGTAPDGTFTVSASAQSSGAAVSAISSPNSFTIDGTAPTVDLSSTTVADNATTTASPISFTASFNELVTSLRSSGITVTNGTVTSGPTAGSNNTYTFQVTPSAAGTVTVQVAANAVQDRATNGNAASNTYTFTFQAPTIVVAPASLPNGTQGTAYSQTLSASGGSGTYAFAITAGTLPAGLSLTSGTIAGTPTANGTFNFTVTATDNSVAPGPYSGSRSYSLTISTQPVTAAPVVIVPVNGSIVSTTTPTYGGTAPAGATIRVYVDGALLSTTTTANSAGNWAITQPSALTQGSHTVYATAQSSGNTVSANSSTNTFTVDSVRPTVAISSSTATSGSSTSTSPFAYTVTFSEAVTGFVAGDVSVSGGSLSGFSGSGTTYSFNVTPSGAGTVTVNVPANVAQDQAGNGNTAASQYSLTFVAPTVVVAPASLPNGTQGTAYSQTLSASGGSGTYAFAITAGTLPAGLSLTSGTIAGTPTVNGTFNFTVTATDNSVAPGPYSGARSYSLTIAAPPVTDLVISTGSATSPVNVAAGTYNSVTVAGTGFARLNGTVVVNNAFTVQTGGALNTNCQTLTGSGSFTLQDGATLYVCDANGIASTGGTGAIQLSGTRTFSSNADYVYNGTASQVTGSGLPSQVRNLTSTNGNTVTLSAAVAIRQVLALNAGDLNQNGQSLTLLSDASGTALIANLGSGTVQGATTTVQRYIDPTLNAGLGYRHLSAPVFNATVADFSVGGTAPVVNSAYNTASAPGTVTPFPTIFSYDQSRLATSPATTLSTFDKGWVSPTSLNDNAELAFTGFTVQLPGASTLSFLGQVVGSSGTIPLSRASDATAADAGLNLVGNPYPSPLDFSTIGASQRTNTDAAFYVFESTSQYGGAYRSYVNGVGTNSLIGTAQAFFVRVTNGQTNGILALNNGNRVTTYGQQAAVRRTAETRPLVQLTLKGAGKTTGDNAYVYFEQGATEGFDAQYDAMKLPNSSGLNLSTSVAGQQLSIDGRPAVGTVQRVIPLAVGVPAAGSYSLTTAQLLNLDATPVYLRDLQTGALTDLHLTPSYQFSVTNASALITGRFELVFSPQQALATVPAALVQQVALYPNPAKKAAFVELPASLGRQAVTATLVDALGRQVRTINLPAQGALAHQLDLSELATGVYALRMSTSAGVIVKKLVIE